MGNDDQKSKEIISQERNDTTFSLHHKISIYKKLVCPENLLKSRNFYSPFSYILNFEPQVIIEEHLKKRTSMQWLQTLQCEHLGGL